MAGTPSPAPKPRKRPALPLARRRRALATGVGILQDPRSFGLSELIAPGQIGANTAYLAPICPSVSPPFLPVRRARGHSSRGSAAPPSPWGIPPIVLIVFELSPRVQLREPRPCFGGRRGPIGQMCGMSSEGQLHPTSTMALASRLRGGVSEDGVESGKAVVGATMLGKLPFKGFLCVSDSSLPLRHSS